MAILKTFGKIFGGFLFSTTLGLLIFALALSQFLQYETIQPPIANILQEEISKSYSNEQLTNLLIFLKNECTNKNTIDLPVGQETENKINATLKCSEINTAQPSDLSRIISVAVFDKIYYKKYDCEFLKCFQKLQGTEKFTLFLSIQATEFFSSILKYLEVGVAAGLIILIVSIRTWHGITKSIGISCIFIGISYFILPVAESQISTRIPQEQATAIMPIINIFFRLIRPKLLIVLIIGIVLAIIGYTGSYLVKGKKS